MSRKPERHGSRSPGSELSTQTEVEDEPVAPDSRFFSEYGLNAGAIEDIQDRFSSDPHSVDPKWGAVFQSAHEVTPAQTGQDRPVPSGVRFQPMGSAGEPTGAAPMGDEQIRSLEVQEADRYARVLRLIHFYRARGHRVASSDPLGAQSTHYPELDAAHYGFGDEDMQRPFITGDLPGPPLQTLAQIMQRLEEIYCGSMGVEYMHIEDPGRKAWLQSVMEEGQGKYEVHGEERSRIYSCLSRAELFEQFLHTRFLGQKRFSLEGGETAVAMLDLAIETAPSLGIREFVVGMSHRGRLNILVNVLGKSNEAVFSEFQDNPLINSPFGSGDVKYHKGYSTDRINADGESVHLTLTSNPSHLEAVDPVVLGRARAKQVRSGDHQGAAILPLLLHGDAAFAGQGVVAETLNLSQLAGYSTGGTLHLIINNQIGFTTNPAKARSTLYCSDVAKMIQVPIFHVNGDDPEAAVRCIRIALAYRQRFQDDVVIDLVCYRRHGHNEGDEPAFTQPHLYSKIRSHPSARVLYAKSLNKSGLLGAESTAEIDRSNQQALEAAYQIAQTRPPGPDEPYEPRGPWSGFDRIRSEKSVDTAVSLEALATVSKGLAHFPDGFAVHAKLQKLIENRGRTIRDAEPIDWAMGEALAFGTLVLEGVSVRLSGQDSSRGTFSQRHAVFVDQESGEEYAPLGHLSDTQARFEVYDSLLSEAAVLGFEYGYSLADPRTLTLWEAQFGDFANGAQIIIDQFISSAHVKWARMSGLVMLLPHGYEGQGPEHSSARVERFLQMSAEDSSQVVNCTTVAQYFHVLRRQMKRNYRSPLVIFTPKSLLRSKEAASSVVELTQGRFRPVIEDPIAASEPEKVERLLLSSGKIYYELMEERRIRLKDEIGRVALVRIEELYPWPEEILRDLIGSYQNLSGVAWVQEEPRNMGPWSFVLEKIQQLLPEGIPLEYIGRSASASTATGSMRIHRRQQMALLQEAFEPLG